MSAYDEALLAEINEEVGKLSDHDKELVDSCARQLRHLVNAYGVPGLLALSMVGVEMSMEPSPR